MKSHPVLATALFLSLSTYVNADVIYDLGATQRPIAFTNIAVAGSTYNVSVTYNNNGATNPLRIGDLPDGDIGAAVAVLLADLNDEGIESTPTFLWLQPNVDTLPLSATQFQYSGFLQEPAIGINDWGGAPATFAEEGVDHQNSFTGFLQFTAVPEPSGVILLLGCLPVSLFSRQRQR